jgi:hypothetical protein
MDLRGPGCPRPGRGRRAEGSWLPGVQVDQAFYTGRGSPLRAVLRGRQEPAYGPGPGARAPGGGAHARPRTTSLGSSVPGVPAGGPSPQRRL